MQEKDAGIVLRKRRLTESSLVIHWLTTGHGRIATVAKGALRPHSPFRGKLDLFHLCEFTYVPARKSDLHTLREAATVHTFPALREDMDKLQQASYAAALIEQTTETGTPMPEVFRLFAAFLAHIGSQPFKARHTLALELKLLNLLGLSPDLENSSHPGSLHALAAGLTQGGWSEIMELEASREDALKLRQFLHGFIIHHLGRIPKGRPV